MEPRVVRTKCSRFKRGDKSGQRGHEEVADNISQWRILASILKGMSRYGGRC